MKLAILLLVMLYSSSVLADKQHADINQKDFKEIIAYYTSKIRGVENSHGPYDFKIVENLSGLGITYQLLDHHKQAIQSFSQALHINRVNSGFYALGNIVFLEHLLRSYIASKDWTAVDDTYAHIYWIYKRNYEKDDIRLLPVLKELYVWHSNAVNVTTGEALEDHEIMADDMFYQARRIIVKHTGKKNITECYLQDRCCLSKSNDESSAFCSAGDG